MASSGERIPPCGVPVMLSLAVPLSVRMPAFKNAFTSASTRLSPTRARTRSIRAECEISSKQAVMSPSSTHSYVLDARKRVSAMASCARRLGLKPYEHDTKSASKIGSSTSFKDACTTRSATVGIPSRRRLRDPGLGIIRSRTGSGRKLLDRN